MWLAYSASSFYVTNYMSIFGKINQKLNAVLDFLCKTEYNYTV